MDTNGENRCGWGAAVLQGCSPAGRSAEVPGEAGLGAPGVVASGGGQPIANNKACSDLRTLTTMTSVTKSLQYGKP